MFQYLLTAHEFTALLASEVVGSDIRVMAPAIVLPPIIFGVCGLLFDDMGFIRIPGRYKKSVAVLIGGVTGVLVFGPTGPALAKGLIAGYLTTKGVEKLTNKTTIIEEYAAPEPARLAQESLPTEGFVDSDNVPVINEDFNL